MASPQKENGFTPIAHEIIEHLVQPGINGSEYRIILFVLRKTYGYAKKQDRISLTQFQKSTLMGRRQVVRTLKSLGDKRLLVKEGNTYSVCKNWEQWVVVKRPLGGQKTPTDRGQKTPKSRGQKTPYNRKKETITKERATGSPDIIRVIDSFKEINPAYNTWYGNKTERSAVKWLLDTYGPEDVQKKVAFLPRLNKMPYAPQTVTPWQLRNNIAKIVNFISQQKTKTKSWENNVIW